MYCSSKNKNSKTCVHLDQGFTFAYRRIRRRLLQINSSSFLQMQPKILATAFLALLFGVSLNAQIFHPISGTTTLTAGVDFVDGDVYYDSGGASGNYIDNELGTLELCANPGEAITIDFVLFDVEASGGSGGQCWDHLTVSGDATGGDDTYAGDTFDLGSGLECTDATNTSGDATLGPFVSTPGGCLTFVFDSDNSVSQSGWEAIIAVDNVIPSASCSITSPTNSSINIQLDGTGTASINVLTTLIVSAGITTGAGCNRYRLYTDPTTWVDRSIFSPLPLVTYDCNGTNGTGTYTYEIYADDDNNPSNGQAGPVTLEVTVVDTDDPFITCLAGPFSTTTSTGTNDDCRAPVAGLTHPNVSDNCSATLAVTYANTNQPGGNDITDSAIAGDPNNFEFYLGTTTVTYVATDPSGNTNSIACSFTVTVTDDEKPDWNEPSVAAPITSVNTNGNGRTTVNVVLDCQSPTFATDLAFWMAYVPTADDECDGMLTAVADGSPSVNMYSCATVNGNDKVQKRTVRRFMATDAEGNTRAQASSDHFRLRIFEVDQTAPSITTNTGITSQVVNGGTLTMGTDSTWNPMVNRDACEVNLNATMATDISISSMDCNAVTTSKSVIVISGAYTALSTAGNNAAAVYEVGEYEITYNMTDVCGNMSSFMFTLVIEDDSGPVYTPCPTDIVIPDTDVNECSAEVSWARPTATDCSGMMSIVPTAVGPTGQSVLIFASGTPGMDAGDFDIGTSTVTYTFTDTKGNTSSCSFTVTVSDMTAPTISCSGPAILQTVCENATVPNYSGFATAMDNCAGVTVVQSPLDTSTLEHLTLSLDLPPLGPSDGDQFIVTFKAVDASGNESTSGCSMTVTLQDNDVPIPAYDPLPVLNSDTLIQADCGSITVEAPTATDCNGVVYWGTPSFANGNPAPNMYTFDEGTYVITWTINDGSGNVLTQVQTIEVQADGQAPTIAPHADDAVDTDLGVCTADYDISLTQVFPPAAGPYDPSLVSESGTYKDNCGIASITYQLSGATTTGSTALLPSTVVTLNKGTTTITYVAMDAEMNSDTKSFQVTVSDNEDPIPTCTNFLNNLTGSVSDATHDNCSFDIGTSDTSYDPAVTDNCGAVTKTILSITPTFFGTGTYTTASDSSLAGASFSPDPDFGSERYLVIWEFEDGDGNTTTCSSILDVYDNEDPSITCIDEDPTVVGNQIYRNTSADNISNACGYRAQGTEFDPTDTDDNCSVNYYVNNLNGTATLEDWYFSVGTTTVEWTVYDNYGNSSTCSVDIVITDNEEPIITCQPGLIVPLPSSGTYTPYYWQLVSIVNENCGLDYANFQIERMDDPSGPMPAVFTCPDATNMAIPIRVTIFDINGNSQSCNTSITIQENVAPKAVCQSVSLSLNASGNVTLNPNDLDGGSTDNCMGSLTFTASQTNFDCTHLGSNTVTMYATDPTGNVDSCLATVTVSDGLAPNVMCRSVNAYLDANGVVTVDAMDFDNGTTDNAGNCGTLMYSINGTAQKSYNCSDVGSHPITLTVTDPSGNSASCTTTVVVIDDMDPDAQCSSFTVLLDNTGSYTLLATDLDNGSSDNCTIPANLAFDINGNPDVTFTCADIGLNMITLTVSDENGNSSTCVSTIEVLPFEEVELTIEDVSGGAGSTITVPVTISKGENMRSVQFSMDILDPTIASIVSASSPLEALGATVNVISSSRVAITWFDANNVGVDLAEGSSVLDVEVELVGIDNELTDAVFGNSPTVVEITQGCGTLPYVTTVNTDNGEIFIDPNTTVTLGGRIATEQDEPVSGVLVTMSGDETGSTFTDANGEYEFTVPSGSSVTFTPTSDASPILGVTALDLAIIQAHIVNGGIISTPYKHIAANPLSTPTLSLGITAADLSLIQSEIVSSNPTFQTWTDSWKFVDAAYSFSNPTAPWLEAFAQSITESSAVDNPDLDFVAIKMADVNDTWPNATGFNAQEGDDRNATPGLLIKDQSITAGEVAEIQFMANNIDDLIAFQAGLKFNANSLEIVSAEATDALTNFPAENVGLQYAEEGLVSVIWYTHESTSVDNEALIFTLEVKALRDLQSLSEVILLSDEIVAAASYESSYFGKGFSIEFTTPDVVIPPTPVEDRFIVYGNQPNPFRDQTMIAFNLPTAQVTTLTVVDASGRTVFSEKIDGIRGMNEYIIQGAELPQTGVLYYQVATSDQTINKRMIRVY